MYNQYTRVANDPAYQAAHEDQLMLFRPLFMTAFLLEGLSPGSSGRPPADLSGDGVVTDEELAKYLKTRVPDSVRSVKRAEQTPQFFRFDESLPRSGQFLFVPPKLMQAEAAP